MRKLLLASILLPLAPLMLVAQNILFSEGFEGAFPSTNWSVGDANPAGGTSYWTMVNSAFGGRSAAAGVAKAYCAGSSFIGGSSFPTYPNYMASFMEHTLDLTSYPKARLTFQYKIPSIETNFDRANVLMGGATIWSQTVPSASTWTLATVDLNPFAGGVYSLRFEFDSDFSTGFEGWYLDEIKVLIPPANDNFTNAVTLSGGSGTTNGIKILASLETGEPQSVPDVNLTGSVWYRWTAPATNIYTFTVPRGGTNDAAVHIFTGTNVSDLTPLGGEFGTPASSAAATFLGLAGSNYWIRVGAFTGGNNAPESNFQLNWGTSSNRTQRLFATNSARNIVLNWYALTFRLQAATNYGAGAGWTDIAGSPPLTIPATNGVRYFRLVCP